MIRVVNLTKVSQNLLWVLELNLSNLEKRLTIFFLKDQIINILGILGNMSLLSFSALLL